MFASTNYIVLEFPKVTVQCAPFCLIEQLPVNSESPCKGAGKRNTAFPFLFLKVYPKNHFLKLSVIFQICCLNIGKTDKINFCFMSFLLLFYYYSFKDNANLGLDTELHG